MFDPAPRQRRARRGGSLTHGEKDELLRVIGDRLPGSFFFRVVHEPDGLTWFAYVSPGVETLLGVTSDAVMQDFDVFARLIVAQDRPAYESSVSLALETCGGTDVVFRIVRPDFQLRWCHLRSTTRRGPGASRLCEGVLLDVTDRTVAEAALHDSEARLKAMVAALPDMIFTLARDGTFHDVHTDAAHLLSIRTDAIVGRPVADVLPSVLAACIQDGFAQVDRTGEVAVLECELPVEGRPGFFEARIVSCGPNRFLAIVRNITETRRSQAETHRARLELGRSARLSMLGEIGASIAHELNQPLTAIVSNARAGQRLLGAGATSDVDTVLEDIARGGLRAGEIIRHLRGMLSRDSGDFAPLSLNEVIAAIEPLIRSELLIRSVVLSTRLAPDLPAVDADNVQLQQVLLNLVLNALESMEAMPSGGRRLVLATRASDGYVEVSVRDTGPGFAPETLARAFEPFYTTKTGGLGMGLRLCASIVDAHGGRIWAEQPPEGGAVVRFTLPARAGDQNQGSSADGP